MIVHDKCRYCKCNFPVETDYMLPSEKLAHICPTCEDKITDYNAHMNGAHPISSGIPDAYGNLR